MGGTLTIRPESGPEAASTARKSVESTISGQGRVGHAVGYLRVRVCPDLNADPSALGLLVRGDGWLVVV